MEPGGRPMRMILQGDGAGEGKFSPVRAVIAKLSSFRATPCRRVGEYTYIPTRYCFGMFINVSFFAATRSILRRFAAPTRTAAADIRCLWRAGLHRPDCGWHVASSLVLIGTRGRTRHGSAT